MIFLCRRGNTPAACAAVRHQHLALAPKYYFGRYLLQLRESARKGVDVRRLPRTMRRHER